MKRHLTLAASGLALAVASSVAGAQTVISRSITAEPVETTVTETPSGTIVTRRPLAEQPAPLVAPQVAGPVLAPPTVPAATFVATPDSVDTFTTRQVVRRAQAEHEARPMITRQVSAHSTHVVRGAAPGRVSTTVRQHPPVHRHTRVVRQTREVALRQPVKELVLAPRERQVVYRTIVEREVVPRQPVFVAPQMAPPIFAPEATVVTAPIAVGTVLPQNVPLYAMPQNVALSVPVTQPYSYAWLGGRAYLVDPASGVVVANVTD